MIKEFDEKKTAYLIGLFVGGFCGFGIGIVATIMAHNIF
jgi:hypothetical protein